MGLCNQINDINLTLSRRQAEKEKREKEQFYKKQIKNTSVLYLQENIKKQMEKTKHTFLLYDNLYKDEVIEQTIVDIKQRFKNLKNGNIEEIYLFLQLNYDLLLNKEINKKNKIEKYFNKIQKENEKQEKEKEQQKNILYMNLSSIIELFVFLSPFIIILLVIIKMFIDIK